MTTRSSVEPHDAGGAAARSLTLVYGVGSYLFFFCTFLYLIGFVGNWVVPKGIDDGTPAASAGTAIAINVLLLGLFAVQHTIMARPAFKEIWTRWVPEHVERTTFVLLSTAILAFMAWQWRPLPVPVWRIQNSFAAGLVISLLLHLLRLMLGTVLLLMHLLLV